MNIQNTVRKRRIEKEVTQEALASALGISRQTIIAIEKGNYIPSLLLGLQLAEYFMVNVEKLFSIKK